MTIQDRLSTFIDKAVALHGDKYDYTNVFNTFVNAKTPVEIICNQHGPFTQTPDQHIRSYNTDRHINVGGCPQCAHASRLGSKRKTHQEFISNAQAVHGDRYSYDKAVYVNTYTKVTVTCAEHGDFQITPKDHLTGKQGCRLCSYRKHFSGKAIRWLEYVEQEKGIVLQRIGRGHEYKIPTTRYYADGYHAETNTIYEFYGDKFHGNLNRFSETDHCHPFDKRVTAGTLYKQTIERENHLMSLGYQVVSIWESEWSDQVIAAATVPHT